ncbi:MAG: zinc-ribbon domain-containing protein [Polyangiaceae bacterium]
MKISCQSCQAKYTIADDKVLGKIVKIRCKKCGETIVVNGAGGTGDAVAASAYPVVPDSAGAEPWTVNVAEGDQRTMTDAEVASAYQQGVITDETYCWRDGMADWLPLREIDALYQACSSASGPSELERPPGVGPALGPPAGNGYGNRQAPVAAAPAATARRAGGRAPAGDLFGGVAQAGSEEDVMTSAPAGMPQVRGGEPEKLVGERNENSVLFSLSALTSKGPGGPPKAPIPGVEASGLIDIKQLSAQLHATNEKKRSGIDDIMNLAGGGAFSPSLTAPTLLTAPSVSEYSADAGAGAAGGPSKNRGLIFLALGGGAFFIVAAIGAMVMLMRPKGTEADGATAGSASAAETALPSAAASAAVAAAGTAASASPSAAAAAAPTDSTAAKAPDTKTATTAPKTAATGAAGAATPTATATAAPKETSLAAAMAGAAATPAPAAPAAPQAGADQPFNMGEAKARLAAAASAAQGCKKADGPSGTGRVVVMFAPSGAAQSATVSGPPFEGTPTGACVSARFRGVHVPAFSGSPFSVSKSFSIN